MIRLELPWPPSMNRYWRHYQGRTLISRAGRQYKKDVSEIVMLSGAARNLDGRLKVEIVAYPPDKRPRDIDNLLKAILDALEKAGVFINDNRIDDLCIRRGEVEQGGRIIVTIEEV